MTGETDRIAALEKKVSDLQDRLDWALIATRALLLKEAADSPYQELRKYLDQSLKESFAEQGALNVIESVE